MDVLITFLEDYNGNTPFNDLKYCLRSIEKHTDVDKVFIVGDKPKWVKNVIHIPHEKRNYLDNRAWDVWHKVYTACLDDRLSDDFVWFCDDHFLLEDIELDSFKARVSKLPFNYRTREGKVHKCSASDTGTDKIRYLAGRYLSNKLKLRQVKDFDLHCPMPLNKEKVIELSNRFPFQKKAVSGSAPYVLKSSYGNYFNIKGQLDKDNKIRNEIQFNKEHPRLKHWFFSCYFIGIEGTEKVFRELYPNKSKYEK
jgi:hypothetical protein